MTGILLRGGLFDLLELLFGKKVANITLGIVLVFIIILFIDEIVKAFKRDENDDETKLDGINWVVKQIKKIIKKTRKSKENYGRNE